MQLAQGSQIHSGANRERRSEYRILSKNISVLDKQDKQLCIDISVLKIVHLPKKWEDVRSVTDVKVGYSMDKVTVILDFRKYFPKDSH